jgi:hypothetical protein
MRYFIPVIAVTAVVMTGEMGGWLKSYPPAESQVEVTDRQQARGGRMPTSGYRMSQLSQLSQ